MRVQNIAKLQRVCVVCVLRRLRQHEHTSVRGTYVACIYVCTYAQRGITYFERLLQKAKSSTATAGVRVQNIAKSQRRMMETTGSGYTYGEQFIVFTSVTVI